MIYDWGEWRRGRAGEREQPRKPGRNGRSGSAGRLSERFVIVIFIIIIGSSRSEPDGRRLWKYKGRMKKEERGWRRARGGVRGARV
jgi:hypothetical protein